MRHSLCSAIAEFLELEGSEERSVGWMLLSTLNLLAAEGNTLVEVGLIIISLFWILSYFCPDPVIHSGFISGMLDAAEI